MKTQFVFKKQFDYVIKDIKKEDAKLRLKAANMVKDRIKEKINKDQVSRPGEPPGKFTGNLLEGIKTRNEEYSAIVGAVAPAYHAILLELGTRRRVPEMKARPFLYPTLEESKADIIEILSGNRV